MVWACGGACKAGVGGGGCLGCCSIAGVTHHFFKESCCRATDGKALPLAVAIFTGHCCAPWRSLFLPECHLILITPPPPGKPRDLYGLFTTSGYWEILCTVLSNCRRTNGKWADLAFPVAPVNRIACFMDLGRKVCGACSLGFSCYPSHMLETDSCCCFYSQTLQMPADFGGSELSQRDGLKNQILN